MIFNLVVVKNRHIICDITDYEKCDQLQIDVNSVYDWAHVNNMVFNPHEFNYVSFNGSMTPEGGFGIIVIIISEISNRMDMFRRFSEIFK